MKKKLNSIQWLQTAFCQTKVEVITVHRENDGIVYSIINAFDSFHKEMSEEDLSLDTVDEFVLNLYCNVSLMFGTTN